ncbi:MAG: MBL fold metallo-hydrolase [Rhodothalassiaceae bacterium]
MRLVCLLVCLLVLYSRDAAAEDDGARPILERALDLIGTVDDLDDLGGVLLEGEGRFDLSAALQGVKPGVDEEVAWRERLLFDPAEDRVMMLFYGQAAPDALRAEELLFTRDRMRRLDLHRRTAQWQPIAPGAAAPYRRLIPQVLLAEALERPEQLRIDKVVSGLTVVRAQLRDGAPVRLAFDDSYGALFWAEMDVPMPFLGPTRFRWRWGDWTDVAPGIKLPRNLSVQRGQRFLKEVRYQTVRTGLSDLDFALPVGFTEADKGLEPAAAEPTLSRVNEGIWQAEGIRRGYHPLIVDFGDFVGIVDAPATEQDLHALPPSTAPADKPAAQLLSLVERRLPGKPVKFVLLTHWHGDSAGGVSAYFRSYPTLVISPDSEIVVDTAAKEMAACCEAELGDDADEDPRQSRVRRTRPVKPATLLVQGKIGLDGEDRGLLVMSYRPVRHAVGMLVALLPEEELVFQTDLYRPNPQTDEEVRSNLAFATWLSEFDLEDWTVLSMHDLTPVPARDILAAFGRGRH